MRPTKQTPIHQTGCLAELVCSNSLKSNLLTNASGLLKAEMRLLNSIVVACADENRLPAGEALAVDREHFAECVTRRVTDLPNVTLIREEITEIPDGVTVIATGPLTSDALAKAIADLTGRNYLYFYDAVAPTITADSIDLSKVFRASRYGKGDADYLNCPMTEAEYNGFWEALVSAERAPLAEFESFKLFEGCMPVEELASRGRQTLSFGPMKPVGLTDPRIHTDPYGPGNRPYAVVQLRQENVEGTLWGMVGFQTRLRWGEQERVFRMIPGLESAEFARFGVMHRNTYIESPKLLAPTLALKPPQNLKPTTQNPLFFAGQITGVEGYVESAAMGIIAGINAARLIEGEAPIIFPRESMMGSLADYISNPETPDFQPMNANFGILPKPDPPIRNKRDRQSAQVELALEAIKSLVF